MAWHKLNMDPH